ncbi:MAG: hypothetical protein KAS39_00880, partial [Actinomycetia bacterium]|nr:hypothetical protein [Actinomycetes bacterium]
SNYPMANGDELFWQGHRINTSNDGGETYDVSSHYEFWMGKYQKEIIIEFEIDIPKALGDTQNGYGPEILQIGLSSSSVGSGAPDHDRMQFEYRIDGPYGIDMNTFVGIGHSAYYSVRSADYFPMKIRLRRYRVNGGNKEKTGLMFYNNVTSQWMNVYGQVDTYYYGVEEGQRLGYFLTRFSVYDTSTRVVDIEVDIGINYIHFLKGAVTCFDWDNKYTTGFGGVVGAAEPYWSKTEIGAFNGQNSANTYRLSIDLNNKTSVIRLDEPLVGQFDVMLNTSFPGSITGGGVRRLGFRLIDTITDFKWEVGRANYGGTAEYFEQRYWNGLTWTIDDRYIDTATSFSQLEINRYSTAGSIEVRHNYDLVGTYSQISTNPLLLETFHELHGATTESIGHMYLDDFWFWFMEGGNKCEAIIPEIGAIDIRQATVHAEDPGNKEVLNRIRHQDSRMMLFTNDDNARWAAAQKVRTLSVPLRQIEMKMDRRGLRIRPGDNFRYLSEKYGIDREIIFRALWAKEGNLD